MFPAGYYLTVITTSRPLCACLSLLHHWGRGFCGLILILLTCWIGGLVPTALVFSGRAGYHAYWSLSEFASLVALKVWLPQVAQRFGADLASAVPHQLLRVPGSYNVKDGGGQCVLVRFDASLVYTPSQLGLSALVEVSRSQGNNCESVVPLGETPASQGNSCEAGTALPAPPPPRPAPRCPPQGNGSSGLSIAAANIMLLAGGSLSAFIGRLTSQKPGRSMFCPFHEDKAPSLCNR